MAQASFTSIFTV
jgi:hypothetical protein